MDRPNRDERIKMQVEYFNKYDDKSYLNALEKYASTLEKQLIIQRVTFCLPIEGDTFEKWFDKHFVMLGNTMVEAKNQATIKYNQEEILELYSFLTDRWSVN